MLHLLRLSVGGRGSGVVVVSQTQSVERDPEIFSGGSYHNIADYYIATCRNLIVVSSNYPGSDWLARRAETTALFVVYLEPAFSQTFLPLFIPRYS